MSYDEICPNPPELESTPEDNVFISKEPQIEIAEKKSSGTGKNSTEEKIRIFISIYEHFSYKKENGKE